MSIFTLPDLGEGLPDAEIREWHVKVGDEVALDQPLVSMETAKAVVEVPAPQAGKITQLHGKPGDTIKTGAPLVEFAQSSKPTADSGTVVGKIETSEQTLKETFTIGAAKTTAANNIKITPALRQLAKKLEVDLANVTATGPGGAITQADIERASTPAIGEPLHGARRAMARAMTVAHAQIAAVTLMDDADIHHWANDADITVRLIQALVRATQEVPALNAWYDGKTESRQLQTHVNLGLAVDTGEQLVVPVIHGAEKLDARELRAKVERCKHIVATHTAAPGDLAEATITLSNFGKFAGRYASPIIVPPMVAILAVGKRQAMVVAQDGKPVVHDVLPLSLTFDHRVVTGAEASRFLATVIAALQAP